MTDEVAEPLPVLHLRLAETGRERTRWLWAAAGTAVLLLPVMYIGAHQADAWSPIVMIAIIVGMTTFFLHEASKRSHAIRALRERIAWAQASQPGEHSPPASTSNVGVWHTFAGVIITAVTGIVVALIET